MIRIAARKMLADDYQVELAENGELAWEWLQQHPDTASMVFTDLSMPVMDGMALLAAIRGADDETLAQLPVIILTGAEDDETVKQAAMEAGATDFILKPFDTVDLLSRAKSCADFARRMRALQAQSDYDSLTGLYNAQALARQGEKAVSFARRRQLPLCIALLELRDMQDCYRQYGKKAAQAMLTAVAGRLQGLMREEDLIARTALGRFIVLLPMTTSGEGRSMTERMQQTVSKLVFDLGGQKLRLRLDGAVAHYCPQPEHTTTCFDDLLQRVEQLYAGLNREGEARLACEDDDADAVKADLASQPLEAQAVVLRALLAGDFDAIDDHTRHRLLAQLQALEEYEAEKEAMTPVMMRA